jgi:hypothetical protein
MSSRTSPLRVRTAHHIPTDGYEEGMLGMQLTLSVDWGEDDTQIPGGNAHLWEESWDDDDTNEEFAVQLR